MSEIERRKAILTLVKDCENKPVNIFHYIYMEYDIGIIEDLSEEDAYHVLCHYLSEEDIDEKYYWFDGKLYKEYSSEDIDPNYHKEAHLLNSNCISLDCTWYNGGGSFQEVACKALKELEGRVKIYG